MGSQNEPEEGGGDREALGRRLRVLRKARKWSMRDLAERAGASLSYISQIEAGTANVSVAMLRKLAGVFGIEWIEFYQEMPSSHGVLKKADRPAFDPGGGQRHYAITRRPLVDVEVGVVEYEPGAFIGGDDYTHDDCHEIFVVLKGRFAFRLDGEEFELSEGDSVDFRSSVPHMVRSLGPEVGEGLWIAAPPTGRPVPAPSA
jgi:transcriptional regulator with XRE-family HTH domain